MLHQEKTCINNALYIEYIFEQLALRPPSRLQVFPKEVQISPVPEDRYFPCHMVKRNNYTNPGIYDSQNTQKYNMKYNFSAKSLFA